MTTLNRITNRLNTLDRRYLIQYGLVSAWVLAMIALPIMKWTIGDQVRPQAVTFALTVQFFAVVDAISRMWGPMRTARTLVIVAATTWGMEWIGSHTGFPF